jgi:hypothetical protein
MNNQKTKFIIQDKSKIILPNVDQIVKGNVNIKKLSEHRYRITFSKIGKFLVYQVWNKDNNAKMNDKRAVDYVSAKKWIEVVNMFNKKLKEIDAPLFTPTTIMETEDYNNYAFVIRKAYINSYGKVVFTVSTKEISLEKNNTSKKLIQLPEGKCNNARFDIDDFFSFLSDAGNAIGSVFEPVGNFFNSSVETIGGAFNVFGNWLNTPIFTIGSASAFIHDIPKGRPVNRKRETLNGICWDLSQLSSAQYSFNNFSNVDSFYIGVDFYDKVDLSEKNEVYSDQKGYYAYTCNAGRFWNIGI